MDLGISGKRAIVCGGSAGLGRGIAEALAAEGVSLVLVARDQARLQRVADEIALANDVSVVGVAADVSTPDGRATVLDACPQPDILINNAGGPPPGDFRRFEPEDWHRAFDANTISALELIRLTIDGMIDRRFGRIVSITSSMVKAPQGFLALSNAARSALTGATGGIARDVIRHNVTVNNVLPGQFETERLKGLHASIAQQRGVSHEDVRNAMLGQIPAGRFGTEAEFGAYCAFLCSQQAAYITGQNLIVDGGQYPGVM